jgi:hypothetical protein
VSTPRIQMRLVHPLAGVIETLEWLGQHTHVVPYTTGHSTIDAPRVRREMIFKADSAGPRKRDGRAVVDFHLAKDIRAR